MEMESELYYVMYEFEKDLLLNIYNIKEILCKDGKLEIRMANNKIHKTSISSSKVKEIINVLVKDFNVQFLDDSNNERFINGRFVVSAIRNKNNTYNIEIL